MTDGDKLKQYIDNQHKSKVSIANDLKISKQTLFQYFKSKYLTEDVKQRFEQYFKHEIFINNGSEHEAAKQEYVSNKELLPERILIDVMLWEIAKLKSKVFGLDVDDAFDELEKNARLTLRQIEQKEGKNR